MLTRTRPENFELDRKILTHQHPCFHILLSKLFVLKTNFKNFQIQPVSKCNVFLTDCLGQLSAVVAIDHSVFL